MVLLSLHALTRAWIRPVLNSKLLTTLSSSGGGGRGETSNEGIRVLSKQEGGSICLLWKTSNVFVRGSLDVQQKRRASMAVDAWVARSLQRNVAFEIHTPIGAFDSGLVLITPSLAPLPPLLAVYMAVIKGRVSSLRTPAAGMVVEEVVVGPSGSLPSEGLSLVRVSAPFAARVDDVKACLGTQIYRESSGGALLFSLVDIVCTTETSEQCKIGRFLSSLRNAGQEDQTLPRPTPPRFLKLLKREAILHQRLTAVSLPNSAAKEYHTFRGLSLLTSSAALAPRTSSGVLVETALRLCPPPEATNVLDLGCGGGALLLSFMREHGSTGLCVGLDMDSEALSCAEANAKNVAPSSRFLKHSFSRVHELDPSVLRGGFHLVLCNPPFLSERQGVGRVTTEGRLALVAGPRGTECFEEIARSLAQCPHSILRPSCFVVFQLPGGARASDLVWESLQFACGEEDRALRIVDVVEDERGIRRCMVLRLD